MAKRVKQPSKISKLTSEIRSQNQSQESINSSFNERINQLETLGLALIEMVRRVEVGKGSNAAKLASGGTLKKDLGEDKTETSILNKMYNFMVDSADKREKRRQLLNARKKEERKQKLIRMKKSFKMAVRKKITPTTGGLFKTMGLGLIGGVVGGLVWVFQDEIKKSAISIKNSVLNFSGFLVEKFKIISGFFNFLKDKLQPITNWINKKSEGFMKSALNIDTSKGVYEGIKKWVVDFVSDFIGRSTDAITGWLYDIGKGITQWLTKPLDWDNYGKLMATIATRMMAGPFAAIGVALAGPISEGITSTKTYFNKAEYGEGFVNKVRELVDMNPDYKKMDEESKQDIINNIIEQIQTGEAPKDFLGMTKVAKEEVFGKSKGMVLGDVYKERKSKQEELYSSLVGQQKEIKKTRMAEYGYSYVGPTSPDMPDAGYFTSPSGDKVSMDDVNKKLLQLSLKKEILDRATSNISDISDNYLKPALQPLMQAYEDVGNELKRVKDELSEADKKYGVSETATKSLETVAGVGTAIRESYSDDTSPADYTASSLDLATGGLENVLNTTASLTSKGMEKLNPTLEKLSKMDFQEEAVKKYDMVQKAWGKVTETYDNLRDPAKFEAFMNKLQTSTASPNKLATQEPTRPDIQPDPNDDFVSRMMDQYGINNPVSNFKSVINNNSTSETIHDEMPLVRNTNSSVRWSNYSNASPWDLNYSPAR